MFPELFSKRYGLRPTPEGLMFEDVPERARIGLYHIIYGFFGGDKGIKGPYFDLYKRICAALRSPRDRRVEHNYQASEAIEKLIMSCEWGQFYDICDVVWNHLDSQTEKSSFTAQINTMFAEEGLGFELRDGLVEKVGSEYIDAQIKEARGLLREPEFKGADTHFEKAIKAINIRPNPDVENCILDAVSAIESVGRIIANDDKAVLGNIIRSMVREGVIPKLLGETIQKVYAYRGDEPGVAHGLVGDSKVTEDEAECVLAMSAAIIIYLVNKHKKME